MKPIIYAHRGASGRYPENTMSAYQAALRHGANGIEIDVQLSLDQELMVIHDATLKRTTNGTGLVSQHTATQLQRLDAGSWFDPKFRGEKIPLLSDVLSFVRDSQLKLIIELKNFFIAQPNLEQRLISMLHEYDLTARTIVSTFNFNSLLTIKELDPTIRTALLYVGRLREPWRFAAQFKADELHAPYEEVTEAMLKESHRRGLPIITWTINTSQMMQKVQRLGVDGIITNHPLRAHKLFKSKRN